MLPAGTFNTTYAKDMAIIRTTVQWTLFITFVILFYGVFPQWSNNSTLTLANNIAIILIAVLGLQILTGLCGQIALGQSAFIGVGAYVHGVLVTSFHWNFLVAMPVAGLATGGRLIVPCASPTGVSRRTDVCAESASATRSSSRSGS